MVSCFRDDDATMEDAQVRELEAAIWSQLSSRVSGRQRTLIHHTFAFTAGSSLSNAQRFTPDAQLCSLPTPVHRRTMRSLQNV